MSKNKKLNHIIWFFALNDGGEFLRKEFDYDFQIGDTVCYEMNKEEADKANTYYETSWESEIEEGFELEGDIIDKWIDMNNMVIIYSVNIDNVQQKP